jgi:hypothetical protein
MGYADAIGNLGLFIGTAVYARYLKKTPFRKIFFWAQLAQTMLIFLDYVQVMRWNLALGIPDYLFLLGEDVLSQVFSKFKAMPFWVMSAQLCPEHLEATFFALLMDLNNLTGDVSGLIGAQLTQWKGITKTNFDGLDQLTLMRTIGSLIPIFFLFLVPNVNDLQELDSSPKPSDEQEEDTPTKVVEPTPSSSSATLVSPQNPDSTEQTLKDSVRNLACETNTFKF